jgi:hypothetical protein
MIKSRSVKWDGGVACMGEKCMEVLIGKPEEGTARRHKCRWEDTIKKYLKCTVWKNANLPYYAQEREEKWAVLNKEMNFRVLLYGGNFLSCRAATGF